MELRVDLIRNGTVCSSDLNEVLIDAGRAIELITDVRERNQKIVRLDQIRSGKFDMAVIYDADTPVGFLAYQTIDDDASLRYGHLLPRYVRNCRSILASSIEFLKTQGIRSVNGLFNWPQREEFVNAALALGFIRIDRVNMVRRPNSDLVQSKTAEGITIMPWSMDAAEPAARILFENSSPEDRSFHRPYRTLQGCRVYIAAILGGRYGEFLADHSFLALNDDQVVGIILVAIIPGVGINIVDLAVDSAVRGRGIATALIGNVIMSNSKGSNADIILAVTRTNVVAKHLYDKMGFEPTENIQYYYLEM